MESHIWAPVLKPVTDTLAELFPLLLIREYRVLTGLIKFGNPEGLDLRLSTYSELLFSLNLDW